MKGKKLKLSYILSIMSLGGILVFSGCSENNNVYNPDRIQEEAKADFPVKDIDPNQTWETSAVCSASISINEKSGDAYTIKVYTANPYNIHDDATLLSQTTVIDGRTVDFKFDMPAALQYVYVMKVNSKGYSSVVPVAVENRMMKMTFGETSGTTRATSGNTTIQASGIKHPDPLPTEAPSGSINLSTLNNQWNDVIDNNNYIVTSDIKEVNVGKPVNLYIQGEVTLSKLYIGGIPWNAPAGTAKIYLLPNSKLTLIANIPKTINNVLGEHETIKCFSMDSGYKIGIANNAELNCEKAIVFNNNTNLYNCGTISATHLEFNATSQFINDGKVTLANLFSCENSKTTIENNGEIIAGSFHLAGSSSFYNESTGEVKINGQSNIDSNSSVWVNEGRFNTTNLVFLSTSSHWINRCQLYVTEKLTYTPGNSADDGLIMDAGSYAECGTFHGDQACIKMGNKSFFNVLGEAKFNHNLKGFIATGDDYALLKMGSAVQETPKQGFSITYNGKLYVACDNHFEQGNDGSAAHPLIDIKNGAKMTGANNADITIENSECNPGYNSTPGGGSEDKVQTYAYAFEDMAKGVGDYDFNDVVLYVSVPYNKNGKRVIDVTLKAAGASKQLAVLFNNKTIFGNVHEALGVSVGTLVNTGKTEGTEKTETIEVGDDFNLTTNGDFCISDGKTTIHIPNFTNGFKKGDVPYALRIASATWKWPKETINIVEAYNGFEEWAQNASAEPTWYNDYTTDKVMN